MGAFQKHEPGLNLKQEPGLWRLPVTLLGRLGLWGPFEGVGSSSLRDTQPPLGWMLRALTGWKVITELLPV